MKKIAEKVVLVALICITFIFALTTILYVTNVIPQEEVSNNSVAVILLAVLAVIYIGLAIYMIYVTFSENINVRRILIYYDAKGATRASHRVVDNIVQGCAKQVKNIKVRKTTLRVDEKQGLVATVHVEGTAESITTAINELRAILMHNFQETLGLTFNGINFEIDKLTGKFIPDMMKPAEASKPAAASVSATPAETPAQSTPTHEATIETPVATPAPEAPVAQAEEPQAPEAETPATTEEPKVEGE